MTVSAKVIAHSAHPGCPDLITLQLRYPRFIHAEVMTHRAFSRNASSSRAVPVARMIADVEADIAMPVEWGKNQPGMQAREPLTCDDARTAQSIWVDAAYSAITHAKRLADCSAHKQIVNRLLEPFSHISVVVTATDWQNFFDLRCHQDADPTMRALAFAMRNAIADSAPTILGLTGWHKPYVDDEERRKLGPMKSLAASVARCARVSYLNHDGTNPDIQKDLELAEHLEASGHMSPFEHQAGPMPGRRFANLNGWQSNRNMMEAEQ
jgi:hypothetical protein